MANGGGGPSTTGISLRLWNDCQREVYLALHHPYVVSLADGTLPKPAFQHYIAQDAHYLAAFAKAYSLGMAKAVDIGGAVFETLLELLQGVREELKMHKSYAAKWDVDLTNCTPTTATTQYIDFLLDTASGDQDIAVLVASMLPCLRLYGFLGCQLTKAFPEHSHVYGEWIDTYSSEEYLAVPAKLEVLMDSLAGNAEYDVLLRHYRRAMELEVDFFAAQPNTPNPRNIGVLVVDFDNTCTEGNSIDLQLIALTESASKRIPDPEERAKFIDEQLVRTKAIAKQYAKEYDILLDEILPPQVAAVKGTVAFDMEILSSVLMRMSEFDRIWNQKVADSEVLKGGKRTEFLEAAKKVPVRDGCRGLLQQASDSGIGVHVLSVNWSADWIKSTLGLSAKIASRASDEDISSPVIVVHANELEYENGISTGDITRTLECADDKGRAFDDLLLDEATVKNDQSYCSVYVGDSPSDLLPLLAADFGIIIGGDKTMPRFLDEMCIEVKPLVSAPLNTVSQYPPVLYAAASWDEIAAFISGGKPTTCLQEEVETTQTCKVPRVLIVAGSDSGGGAGIQADLKTCLVTGSFGTTAITALTSQNTHGVHSVHVTPKEEIEKQMDAVLSDIGADVVKTGMLPNAETVQTVSDKLRQYNVQHLVVDPVMVSTSGHSLGENDVGLAIKQHLMPLATIITPNITEVETLLGRKIESVSDMEQAARDLTAFGSKFVLIKGGHLIQNENGREVVVDVVCDGTDVIRFEQPAIKLGNTHGTGCTLASAIASELAKGCSPVQAIKNARVFLLNALKASVGLEIGSGIQRPFNHGHALSDGWIGGGQQKSMDLSVFAVTDRACNVNTGRTLIDAVKGAISGGATMIQIREKDIDGGEFVRVARDVVALGKQAGVAVIINDRVDVALAVDADGVHVGQDDISASDVRALIGTQKLLGVSAKTIQEATQAEKDGADYIGVGAVFPTSTKESKDIGLHSLTEICSSVSIPVVAIGGINADNAADTIKAGCKGVAVVSAIFAAENVENATMGIKEVVDKALE